MYLRLLIPLIALILLRNVALLELSSKTMRSQFEQDYQAVVCARADVYRRNLIDAQNYLASVHPYLEVSSDDNAVDEGAGVEIEHEEDEELGRSTDCASASFLVYREANPKLPWIYPNWVFRETER